MQALESFHLDSPFNCTGVWLTIQLQDVISHYMYSSYGQCNDQSPQEPFQTFLACIRRCVAHLDCVC